MHKQFYASGFLFHSASGQILLQASSSESSSAFSWVLFSMNNTPKEEPIHTFQRAIFDTLDITLLEKDIRQVHDYFDEEKKAQHYIFYGVVNDDTFSPATEDDNAISWFVFKQLSKISISPRDKQDIIVAQRVINAEIRDNVIS